MNEITELLWEVRTITQTSGRGWSIITPDDSVDRSSNLLIPEILAFRFATWRWWDSAAP